MTFCQGYFSHVFSNTAINFVFRNRQIVQANSFCRFTFFFIIIIIDRRVYKDLFTVEKLTKNPQMMKA